MNVILTVVCSGDGWCTGFSKRVQFPAMLPVGSLVFLLDGDEFDFGDLTIESYAWHEASRFLYCYFEETLYDQPGTLAEFKLSIGKFGWVTDIELEAKLALGRHAS